jgi:hypothetical protein
MNSAKGTQAWALRLIAYLERPGASLPRATDQSAASHPPTEVPTWMPSVLQLESAGGNRDRAQ